jgi:hypothetical protein
VLLFGGLIILAMAGSNGGGSSSSSTSTSTTETQKEKPPTDSYYRGPVWKSYDAMEQGNDLVRLGVNKTNPLAVMKLANCLVTESAKIEIVYSTFSIFHPSQTQYVVLEGPRAGCQGWIDHEFMEERPRVEENQ